MTKPDWTTAPEDAQFYSYGHFRKHDGGREYEWLGNAKLWVEVTFGPLKWHRETPGFEIHPTTSERNHPAAACQYSDNLAPPVEWPASDDRIDAIGQNGGDGEHYSSEPEWIEWDGIAEKCPVPAEHDLELRFANGLIFRGRSPEGLRWRNNPDKASVVDIVAYRDWTEFTNEHQRIAGTATIKQQAQMSEIYPQYYKDCRHIDSIDVYGVHDLFGIQDASGCLQHASKKILLSGKRNGGKDLYQDIKEARDTLTRKLQLMEADK